MGTVLVPVTNHALTYSARAQCIRVCRKGQRTLAEYMGGVLAECLRSEAIYLSSVELRDCKLAYYIISNTLNPW